MDIPHVLFKASMTLTGYQRAIQPTLHFLPYSDIAQDKFFCQDKNPVGPDIELLAALQNV